MRETVPVLERLRARGVWFAIDDFGTGYSSLNQLCKLPVDVLKVDRAFVEAAGTGAQAEAIVKLIVALAQAIGVHVVAEGVETSEQAMLLASLGCRFAQGYYFAAPLPAEQVSAWLAERLTAAA
ncbi:MAG: EAL domain-containing protein [Chloroflexota bacterium]